MEFTILVLNPPLPNKKKFILSLEKETKMSLRNGSRIALLCRCCISPRRNIKWPFKNTLGKKERWSVMEIFVGLRSLKAMILNRPQLFNPLTKKITPSINNLVCLFFIISFFGNTIPSKENTFFLSFACWVAKCFVRISKSSSVSTHKDMLKKHTALGVTVCYSVLILYW